MALTTSERSNFSTDQLVEVDRIGDIDAFLTPDDSETDAADYKSKRLGILAGLSVGALKARVNITGVEIGYESTVNYSSDNNYTSAEQITISEIKDIGRDGWANVIAATLG